jgi:hypothetical protein
MAAESGQDALAPDNAEMGARFRAASLPTTTERMLYFGNEKGVKNATPNATPPEFSILTH